MERFAARRNREADRVLRRFLLAGSALLIGSVSMFYVVTSRFDGEVVRADILDALVTAANGR